MASIFNQVTHVKLVKEIGLSVSKLGLRSVTFHRRIQFSIHMGEVENTEILGNIEMKWNIGLPYFPAGIYLLKVYNRNTRTRCEICSKLPIKTSERRSAGIYLLKVYNRNTRTTCEICSKLIKTPERCQ